jgi:hypothetical protein
LKEGQDDEDQIFAILALPRIDLQKWLQLRACLQKWRVDRDFEIGIVGSLECHVLEFQVSCDGMLQDFATIQ